MVSLYVDVAVSTLNTIRYADVLLMYAEAVINANGDFATAASYVDMVRSRAGVVTLQQYMDMNDGMFPQLPC